jgi:hypothetical protein
LKERDIRRKARELGRGIAGKNKQENNLITAQ